LSSKNTKKEFYEAHSERLLLDYVSGNPRIEEAIKFCLNWLGSIQGDLPILEVGCGIGSVAYQIALTTSRKVVGSDLSSTSIELGTKLFAKNQRNLILSAMDATQGDFPVAKASMVLMIDVYEHISEQDRPILNNKINSVLADSGILLLTCPSPRFQDFLKKEKPEEVQPVDEIIDLNVLSQLAGSISGEIIYFSHKSIWSPNDYIHIAIAKKGFSLPVNDQKSYDFSFETKSKRWARVLKQLDHDQLTAHLKQSNYFRRPFITKVLASCSDLFSFFTKKIN
jgi:SAM-dependent methyltransferase